MKKSLEIKTELDSTTKRLDELNEMREHLNDNLQTLQSGFVDGKESLDNLQTEQSKLTALDSSIKVLAAKQSDLQTAFDEAAKDETHQTLLQSAKATAIEAETALDQYMELRTEFDTAISDFTDKLLSKLLSFRAKQKEFLQTTGRIKPGSTGAPTMERNDLISIIDDELTAIGVSGKTLNLMRTDYLSYAPLRFGASIATAETIVAQEIYRKEQAAEKAAFAARREETQAAQKAKREAEEAASSRQLEAEQARIIQYRVDSKLPALPERELKSVANDSLAKQADAEARGATVNV
jgi:uncharacterized phage infection (PIP) family protein YhgE